MKLYVDSTDLTNLVDDLGKFAQISPKVMSRSMNSALSQSRTASIRNAASGWKGMGVRTFKVHTNTKNSTVGNLTARFEISGSPISLSDFKAKQNPKRKRRVGKKGQGKSQRAGVRYKLKYGQKTLKNAWLQKSKYNNSLEVFVEEKGKPRGKVRRASITATSMFLESKSHLVFAEKFNDVFITLYWRNLKFLNSK